MSARSTANWLKLSTLLPVLWACTPTEVEETATTNSLPTVMAGGETLQGVALDDATSLAVFRGIPFAAPPTGDRRWKPPAAHTPRSGLQSADQLSPACP